MKMHNSWLEITKSCHSILKNYRRHERKVRQSLFVSVEINSTTAKVTEGVVSKETVAASVGK